MLISRKILFIGLLLFINWLLLGFLGLAANDSIQFPLVAFDVVVVIVILTRSSNSPAADFRIRYLLIILLGLISPAIFIGALTLLLLIDIIPGSGDGLDGLLTIFVSWGVFSAVAYLILLICSIFLYLFCKEKVYNFGLKKLLLLGLAMFISCVPTAIFLLLIVLRR